MKHEETSAWLLSELIAVPMYQRVRATYQRAIRQELREMRWQMATGAVQVHSRETVISLAHERLVGGNAAHEVLTGFARAWSPNALSVSIPKTSSALEEVAIRSRSLRIVAKELVAKERSSLASPDDHWFVVPGDTETWSRIAAGGEPLWFELLYEGHGVIACPAPGLASVVEAITLNAHSSSLLSVLVEDVLHDIALAGR